MQGPSPPAFSGWVGPPPPRRPAPGGWVPRYSRAPQGGAGLDTGGGAIGQALAWWSLPVGPRSHVRVGYGRVRALQSGAGLDSPILELSFSHRFGLGAP